jgi:SAM-dependent methyltransferase
MGAYQADEAPEDEEEVARRLHSSRARHCRGRAKSSDVKLRSVLPRPVRRRIRRGLTLLRAGTMERYFEKLAPAYDEWWLGVGESSGERPGFDDDRERIIEILRGLPPAKTIDIACGTGFLTQHLPGEVVGLDRSEEMLAIARRRAPSVTFVTGDALNLPFEDGLFDRAVICVFYGMLPESKQRRLLHEARRVASELIVVEPMIREGLQPFERQIRRLPDGSHFLIERHYYTPQTLAADLGGGEVLLAGRYFIVFRAPA